MWGAEVLKYSMKPTLPLPLLPGISRLVAVSSSDIYSLKFEVVRRVILAVKLAAVKYFIFVGGTGSLVVPGTHESLADYPGFFPAYYI